MLVNTFVFINRCTNFTKCPTPRFLYRNSQPNILFSFESAADEARYPFSGPVGFRIYF